MSDTVFMCVDYWYGILNTFKSDGDDISVSPVMNLALGHWPACQSQQPAACKQADQTVCDTLTKRCIKAEGVLVSKDLSCCFFVYSLFEYKKEKYGCGDAGNEHV